MSGQARRRAVRAPQAKSASDHFLTEALRTLDPRLNTARVQSARVLDVPLTYQDGQLVSCEPRYFLSSLAPEALSLAHWLLVVRRHWRASRRDSQTKGRRRLRLKWAPSQAPAT